MSREFGFNLKASSLEVCLFFVVFVDLKFCVFEVSIKPYTTRSD